MFGPTIGAILFLIIAAIIIIIAIIIGTTIASGKKVYTSNTNKNIKELLEKEKELYKQINTEIKNAGIINKWQLKRKLGPLYDWYEGGYLN